MDFAVQGAEAVVRGGLDKPRWLARTVLYPIFVPMGFIESYGRLIRNEDGTYMDVSYLISQRLEK